LSGLLRSGLSCIHDLGVGIVPIALHLSALIFPISFMHFSSCCFASFGSMYLRMSSSISVQSISDVCIAFCMHSSMCIISLFSGSSYIFLISYVFIIMFTSVSGSDLNIDSSFIFSYGIILVSPLFFSCFFFCYFWFSFWWWASLFGFHFCFC